MIKAELEKKAREYLAEHSEYSEVFGQTFVAVDTLTAMVDFAEPREKRIAELELTNKKISDECHKLVDTLEKKQNENVDLIGKVAFLENDLNNAKAQIEKMKCCENCIHKYCSECKRKKVLSDVDYWELAD